MNLSKKFLTAIAVLVLAATSAFAQKQPTPDVLTFTNGDQLSGKFVRAIGGSVVFHSDMTGDQTVDLAKIKEMNSPVPFVAIKKVSGKKLETVTGAVTIAGGKVTITPANGAPVTLAAGEIAYLIDEPTYDKQFHKQPFTKGWNGTLNAGFSMVRATQTTTTFTGGLGLVRAEPSVPYLPARNRTSLNVAETYGRNTSPVLPPTTPASPDVVVKTNVFHADAERDEYFHSEPVYALVTASFDHNFSQGLNLQQIYGAGLGWTAIKQAKQTLDLKGDAHYEMQSFIPAAGVQAADTHLFGSTFSEAYVRKLPKGMVFTETGNYIPGWTDVHIYSANVTAALALPVWKRWAASISTTDNYLSNPAPYYKNNSYQFVVGLNYTFSH